MTTQLKNGNFVDVNTHTFSSAFDGAQRKETQIVSLMTRRSLRATRRANRSL